MTNLHKLVTSVSLGILLVCAPGCGTNAPTKAAQAEQILITSVNVAMSQWASHVNAGKATQAQIDNVRKAYEAYYTAQTVAKAAIEKAIVKDPSATPADVATAASAVQSAEVAILGLVNSYLLK